MAKTPVAGRSKTRLAREVGTSLAIAFARTAQRAVMRRLMRDTRWESTLSIAPDAARHQPIWPRSCRLMPQGGGDLGKRMRRPFVHLPPGPVIIVGTDIPKIRPQHIARAFRLLGNRDAVLGPAGDGGYWLVGLKRRPRVRAPFDGVRWSTPQALGDTLANLEGMTVAFADTLDDVDDAAGLRLNAMFSGRVVLPSQDGGSNEMLSSDFFWR